jgi:gamma-glutamylcyclotransferase (GGCT)/AIG2-like uncharacterized protein YtfP
MKKCRLETLASNQDINMIQKVSKAFISENSVHQRVFFFGENTILEQHILDDITFLCEVNKRKIFIYDASKPNICNIQECIDSDVLFLLHIDKWQGENSLQEIIGERIEADKNTLITSSVLPQYLPFINKGLQCLLRDALIVQISNITFKLFVYGTLKKGFDNHSYLRNSQFVAEAKTAKKYPMITKNQAFPYLINQARKGHHVQGEVYVVDYETFIEIECLEGHPTHYIRNEIDVQLENKDIIKAWCYFLADKIDLKQYDLLTCFERN